MEKLLTICNSYYLKDLEELTLYIKDLIKLQLDFEENDGKFYFFLKNNAFELNIEIL